VQGPAAEPWSCNNTKSITLEAEIHISIPDNWIMVSYIYVLAEIAQSFALPGNKLP
jgi:hypothetical protein